MAEMITRKCQRKNHLTTTVITQARAATMEESVIIGLRTTVRTISSRLMMVANKTKVMMALMEAMMVLRVTTMMTPR